MALTSPPSPFSAGVGRTGTFITIEHVLEQVKKENSANIPQVINKIRQQRMKMVQTVVGSCVNAQSELIQISQCIGHELAIKPTPNPLFSPYSSPILPIPPTLSKSPTFHICTYTHRTSTSSSMMPFWSQ